MKVNLRIDMRTRIRFLYPTSMSTSTSIVLKKPISVPSYPYTRVHITTKYIYCYETLTDISR